MPLTDRQISNAKPKEKAYKLNDAKGLYLYVTPKGTKSFRLDFALHGKRSTLTIGKYPAVLLSEARIMANDALKQIANGINPAKEKQKEKEERKQAQLNTFEHIARQWHQENSHRWKPNHATRIISDMEKDVFPYLADKAIHDISVSDVKAVLMRIAERGALVTAEKIRQWIGAIFSYAGMLEITDRNPALLLRGFLEKRETKHMPALPASELTEFYRRLALIEIEQKNRLAIMLNMLVFVRSTELRGAMWQEIDWDNRQWNIPAERMKMKLAHTVPLSDWAMELLRELQTITGETPYLFPSRIKLNAFISEGTLIKIMNSMGYKGIATPHGFRSLASSLLNEQGFNPDAIERQLAHVETNKIRSAYNRAEYMAERATMMQWYSDHLKAHYMQAQTA